MAFGTATVPRSRGAAAVDAETFTDSRSVGVSTRSFRSDNLPVRQRLETAQVLLQNQVLSLLALGGEHR